MSNPDYPEGVTERDIDRIGEPFPLTEEDVFVPGIVRIKHICPCDGSCKEEIAILKASLDTIHQDHVKAVKKFEDLEVRHRETERARDEWRNQGKANSDVIRDIRYVLSQIEEPK